MTLKIPPPFILILTALLMWGLSKVELVNSVQFGWLAPVALVVFLIGFIIGGWAALSFKKADTTIDPRTPEKTSELVSTGVFGISRNPMYLSMALQLSALAIWLGNPLNALLLPLFIWYITKFQIIPEEQALEAKFPDAVANYQARVRRWV